MRWLQSNIQKWNKVDVLPTSSTCTIYLRKISLIRTLGGCIVKHIDYHIHNILLPQWNSHTRRMSNIVIEIQNSQCPLEYSGAGSYIKDQTNSKQFFFINPTHYTRGLHKQQSSINHPTRCTRGLKAYKVNHTTHNHQFTQGGCPYTTKHPNLWVHP